MNSLNENVQHLECIRCQSIYPINDYYTGCPQCLQTGKPASLSFTYKTFEINRKKTGLSRFSKMLPYQTMPSLGEGSTPNIHMKDLGEEIGIKSLWVKNEGQNPTGSHKDRMSPLVIARAKATKKEAVAVASSGNAGVSIATYAAAAKLKCIVLTTKTLNPIWQQAIEITGTELIFKEKAMDRWSHMKEKVKSGEWYSATNFINPPVGSNPFGVQGYKTVAYEIVEDFDELPEYIVIPSSRGDLLWGIWQGLKEALEADYISFMPKLIAVEPFPRLEKVMNGHSYVGSFEGDATDTPSVGGSTVTYQSVQAIQESKGIAVAVPAREAYREQRHLANHGIYAERSSSLVLGALKKLVREGVIRSESKVLLIISSNGYKELILN